MNSICLIMHRDMSNVISFLTFGHGVDYWKQKLGFIKKKSLFSYLYSFLYFEIVCLFVSSCFVLPVLSYSSASDSNLSVYKISCTYSSIPESALSTQNLPPARQSLLCSSFGERKHWNLPEKWSISNYSCHRLNWFVSKQKNYSRLLQVHVFENVPSIS